MNKNAEIVTVESSSSLSESECSTSNINTKPESESQSKIDILFDECHWYDIPCPHPLCYSKNIRFDSHQKFKNHHEALHCPRSSNGDINRAKDSLRWKCPVIITRKIDNKEIHEQCSKISNSWYNYAGHITSHKGIGHGWGCALKPCGKRKKTNVKKTIYNQKLGKYVKLIVCGKRTSTKHHLLAHMGNVHKEYNVIDTNARQYNKKNGRNGRKRRNKSIKNNKKRKFIDITRHSSNNSDVFNKIHTNNHKLLSMIPPSLQSIHNYSNNYNTNNLQSIPTFPNLFNVPILSNNLSFTMQTPPKKKMRLIPNSKGYNNDSEQFEFLSLLCKAVSTHKGCNKCCSYESNNESNSDDEGEIEASLPSLSTYNSNNNASPSTISNLSMSNDDSSSKSSVTNNPLSLPKLPIIFPNFNTSSNIQLNTQFTFDLNQFDCSNNNKTNTTNQTNVITSAIPSLPPNIF